MTADDKKEPQELNPYPICLWYLSVGACRLGKTQCAFGPGCSEYLQLDSRQKHRLFLGMLQDTLQEAEMNGKKLNGDDTEEVVLLMCKKYPNLIQTGEIKGQEET